MKPVLSTAEIMFLKWQNLAVDKAWADWAVEMLEEGYDTEYLLMLASISNFDNQFELKAITDKVFKELSLDLSDEKKVTKNYISYQVERGLTDKIGYDVVLDKLRYCYYNSNYQYLIQPFYNLYYAKDDLKYGNSQYYWDGADRTNIDTIIENYFREWLYNNPIIF
jgi:hypothetical protein